MSLIGAIDAGTSSARFIVFRAKTTETMASHKCPLQTSSPQMGWLEQDPREILTAVMVCIVNAVNELQDAGANVRDIVAVGVANQRETIVVWDKNTGEPLHNAILWSDTRTTRLVEEFKSGLSRGEVLHLQKTTGLPLFNYFSAVKLRWLLENCPKVRQAVDEGRCLCGTVDTWIMWNMLNGIHITDVTNASRTMLMNINTLEWDAFMLDFFKIPREILPEIRSSAEIYGKIATGPLKGIPIAGCLGDQQAALVGQLCLNRGDTKATYGTGCFVLNNTGTSPCFSSKGLLTTVAYKIGRNGRPVYALEGSAAVAGSAFAWLRDNLGIIEDLSEIGDRAAKAPELGSVSFVPAFSGLFAPHWDQSARGIVCDITEDTTTQHVIKAAMEAVCYQVKDIVDAMNDELGVVLDTLKVDGEAADNGSLMQMQADLGGFGVTRAGLYESTALGAALAAQWGVGLSHPEDYLVFKEGETFRPQSSEWDPAEKHHAWKEAVNKSKEWAAN